MREKLIELLCVGYHQRVDDICEKYENCDDCPYSNAKSCAIEINVDHLIANGVTVRESDGCGFCKTFDFSSARTEAGKYGTHICLASSGTAYPTNKQFRYCPECGRRLSDIPKEGEIDV